MAKRQRSFFANIFIYTILISYFLIVVTPFLWIIYTSCKSTQEIFTSPFGIPKAFLGKSERGLADAVRNYKLAWHASHFKEYFFSSVKVTSISLVLILLITSMASYAIARYECQVNKYLFILILSGMIIPGQLLLVPLFFEYSLFEKILTPVVQYIFSE